MTQVLVVGAGPVGLTMAAELARHGVRSRIIDRQPKPSPYCRAIGITPRTLEVWDDMGIARDMIDAGIWLRGMRSILHGRGAQDEVLDLHDLPYGTLGLPQYATERLLTDHLFRFGVPIERGLALSALNQDDAGVVATVDHADGRVEQIACGYVIGCDGAHSTVRNALGIGFPGDAFPMSFMLADVKIDWDLPRGMALRALRPVEDSAPEMFIAIPLPERGRYRVSILAPPVSDGGASGTAHGIQSESPAPGLAHVQAVADALVPRPPRLSDMRWSSLFRISMRLADRYRNGRVFIAGDAAHIHPPTGGQGMNTGIQDAYNLAWKLALVVRGAARAELLQSYEAERRPVGAEVVARTRAASERYGREQGKPDRLADTQIRLSYASDGAAADGVPPRTGDRAPDCNGLRQANVGFPLRLFDVLRGPAHVLLIALPAAPDTGQLARLESFVGGLRLHVRDSDLRIAAIASAGSLLPEIVGVQVLADEAGTFAAAWQPTSGLACLIRPDGYLSWRGADWTDPALLAELRRIFVADW